jgi:hypothetical protein
MKRTTKYFETIGKHIIFSSIVYKEWSFDVRTKVKHSTHYIFLSTWCERNIRPYFKSDTFYPVSAMTKLSFIYFQPTIRNTNKANRTRATRTAEHNTTDAPNGPGTTNHSGALAFIPDFY